MSNLANQIVKILNCEYCRNSTVIVTTRPWKAHQITNGINLKKQYALVKIEGFKRKDVKTYVQKFFQHDTESEESLLEYMEEASLIAETMAPFPLFCAMMCHMWKEVDRREVIRKLQTFSQLFHEMIKQLKEHFVSKHSSMPKNLPINDLEKKIDNHMQEISKIAFDGLENDQLSFSETSFTSCMEGLRTACEVGILTKERKMSRKQLRQMHKLPRLESTVSFPHKLFQEYIASIYLYQLYLEKSQDYEHLLDTVIIPKIEYFKYVIYFMGSINKDVSVDLLARFIPKCDTNFIVEVAFECHHDEAVKLVQTQKLQKINSLELGRDMSRHVLAGYLFTIKELVRPSQNSPF